MPARPNPNIPARPLTAKQTGGDYKKLPPGAHFAVCNMIVDLGMQAGEYEGKANVQHKVYIRWEVPDERVSGTTKAGVEFEGPMTIGRKYTLSLNERAHLRQDLENWRGKTFTDEEVKGFNVFSVLGKCCLITVVHAESSGKTYANVKGIVGLTKDLRERAKKVTTENELLAFSLEGDGFDQETYEKLPEWLQEQISNRIEEGAPAEKIGERQPGSDDAQDFDDDIPF